MCVCINIIYCLDYSCILNKKTWEKFYPCFHLKKNFWSCVRQDNEVKYLIFSFVLVLWRSMTTDRQKNPSSYVSKTISSSYIGLKQGCMICLLTHPFDLIKTKMQANPAIRSGCRMSLEIFKTCGIRGFYTGGSMNFSRVLVKGIYISFFNGYLKDFPKLIDWSLRFRLLISTL